MTDLKNVLEVVNEIAVLPIAIITFFLLISMFIYLRKKDPDLLRSRIFLKYGQFKRAFILLALFAFLMILHVSFIYIPHYFSYDDSLLGLAQEFFGFGMVLTLIAFVGTIYISLK